ncbi:MAG: hypothetical protein A2Y25_07260 [Candidatus Melainabacteria bacterium GWF2_37_15]|nr:MAG: hypothetical protein A2Y25_07260 [Candidatus Melainabacteria bacterium GWF2_37_15]
MKQKIVKLFLLAVIGVLVFYIVFPKAQNNAVIEKQPPVQSETLIQAEDVQEQVEEPVITDKYLAGKTPDEAWKSLIQVWKDGQESTNLDIYTSMAKFVPLSPEHADEYDGIPYEIIQRGDYAIVYFEGRKDPPFLFCKTEEGWKFDVVHQKKLIRKGASSWGVAKNISPYLAILRKFPTNSGIDIPLEDQDIYTISKDKEFTQQITELENLYKGGKMKFEEAAELGRLYAISTLGFKAIPILNKVKEKLPENNNIYKYLAIAYVDSTYDYGSAQEQMEKYIKFVPENEFGHNFLGYLFLELEKYTEAEVEFKKALEINPSSCYACSKLARLYKTSENEQKFKQMYKKTRESCKDKDYERFVWLVQWLHNGNKK